MKVKVWGVMEGPIAVEDVEDSDVPLGSNYFLVCKSEIDGVMGEDNFGLMTLNLLTNGKSIFLRTLNH